MPERQRLLRQSDDGRGLESLISIAASQHLRLPSPAFVQSASAPQIVQKYRFPSRFAMFVILHRHASSTLHNRRWGPLMV